MLGANVLDKRDILMGNGKLYIGGVDVGQLKGDVSFTPTAEYKEFEAGVPKQVVKSTKTKEGGTLKAGIAELNPENVAKIVGSNNIVYTTGEVAAEPVVLGAAPVQLKKGRHITELVVKKGTTPAVLDTDYVIIDVKTGRIARKEGSTVINAGDTVTVSYKYRKSAKITAGGGAGLAEMPCQYVYDSPDGDQRITLNIYLGQMKGGQPITFKEDDYVVNDFELIATADTSRPAGDQLYSFTYDYFPDN